MCDYLSFYIASTVEFGLKLYFGHDLTHHHEIRLPERVVNAWPSEWTADYPESLCIRSARLSRYGAHDHDDDYSLINWTLMNFPQRKDILQYALSSLDWTIGFMNIREIYAAGVSFPSLCGGGAIFSSCDLRGAVLPEVIGDSARIECCDLMGAVLPKRVMGPLTIARCSNINESIVQEVCMAEDYRYIANV